MVLQGTQGLVSCDSFPRAAHQRLQALRIRGRSLRHKPAGMGEMHVLAILNPREIQSRIVVVAGQAEALPPAVRIDHADDVPAGRVGFNEAAETRRRLVRQWLGARHEEHMERLVRRWNFPELAHFGDEVEALAKVFQVGQQVRADPAHNRPQRFARLQPRNAREAPQQRHVHR